MADFYAFQSKLEPPPYGHYLSVEAVFLLEGGQGVPSPQNFQ